MYWLASVLMHGRNSCFPPESLPIYPSERASVLMREETAVPPIYVLYHKCVSRVIMLTEQKQIFALKMWYKSGFPVIVAQWHNHFD